MTLSGPPALRSPLPSVTTEAPGFKTGLAHFAHGAERLGKRVAVLMGIVGAMSTFGSIALATWVTHQDFVQQNQLAQINRTLEDMRVLLTIQQSTFGPWQQRVVELEADSKEHGERLAALGIVKKGRK